MKYFLFLCFSFLFLHTSVQAQANREYLIASQLIRMQDYERAKNLLEDLVKKEPTNAVYLQQLVICYGNLKQYEDGITLLSKSSSKIKGNFNLENEFANLNYLDGDSLKAFDLWANLIKENNRNIMVYQLVGNTLVERREFARAAQIYKQGRVVFKNSFLFLNELANAYLQSNNYGDAAKELISIVENNPGRTDLVQRQFARFADEFLYDEAILELEEANLDKTSTNETVTQAKRELLLWLYLERNVDKRAISWAMMLEKKNPSDYFVFNVAQNLIRKESFELADEALNFYLQKGQEGMRAIAFEAKANLYLKWAKKSDEQGLNIFGKSDSLITEAAQLFEKVVHDFPDFDNKAPVYLKLIDIYLTDLGQVEKARSAYKTVLSNYENQLNADDRAFLLGRFAMLDGNFRMARMELTKANKANRNADMLEKSRYFLALNDFYAGDFEFAKIQLKSVERQPTSFYANDAVQLRNWIRKGMQKDSVLPELVIFSKALFAKSRTEYKASFDILSSNFETLNQLQDEAAEIIVDFYRKKDPKEAYEWLKSYKDLTSYEKLYFEQVSLGYILVQKKDIAVSKTQVESDLKSFLKQYPSGFFAVKVRELLKNTMGETL